MTFEGYSFKVARNKALAILSAIVGFAVFSGGWILLWILQPEPGTQDLVMAGWVALMVGAAAYLVGPRRQEWGHGLLTDQQVVWEAAETVHGELVRRQHPAPWFIRGVRYFWLVVLAITLVVSLIMHSPSLLAQNKPNLAVFLVLGAQAWITPLYREVWLIRHTAGRKKIYVTGITSDDAGISA